MACIDENFLPRIFFSRIFLAMNFSQTTVVTCAQMLWKCAYVHIAVVWTTYVTVSLNVQLFYVHILMYT